MYFDELDSVKNAIGTSPQEVAGQIAKRYIADNPAFNVELSGVYDNSFKYGKNGKIILDFNQIYPDAKIGSYAYAFGYIRLDAEKLIGLSVSLMTESHV